MPQLFVAHELSIEAEPGMVRITLADDATILLTSDEAAEIAQAIAAAVTAAEST